MNFPAELKYTKDHEWISLVDSKIGVTAYAIEQLGDIVHIELPEVGKEFKQGASFGTIESTKTVSDLYMPVNGKIVAVNQAVLKSPESLQADPYKNGWLIQVASSSADTPGLMTGKDYATFIAEH
ncbi:MAG: glycine cleavage system protein [Pseudomonadota bacterium]|jgi:glycine cleavage system H protein